MATKKQKTRQKNRRFRNRKTNLAHTPLPKMQFEENRIISRAMKAW